MHRMENFSDQILTEKPKQYTRVAVCTLNQWAMDFNYNKQNIIESINIAKKNNCKLRVGPELEIPGYGCEDHFLEMDTVEHSWDILGEILEEGHTQDLLVDMGMPIYFNNALYNCRVLCLNKKIILVRPKIHLADEGNYREPRYFTRWSSQQLEKLELPYEIQQITKQRYVPMGNAIVKTNDTSIGYEICQELWVPQPMNTSLFADGCEIVLNPSSSHYEMRKQRDRTNMIAEQTSKNGGIYLYSNTRGCDGGRVYFDGNSIIAQNGKILQMSDMFSIREVDVLVNDLDLFAVKQKRASKNEIGSQNTINKFPRVYADITLGQVDFNQAKQHFMNESEYFLQGEEEISYGPSCYCWDYLKRSGGMGYFLALSGGADSASSALIIFNMCKLVFNSISSSNDNESQKTLKYLRRIVKDDDFVPKSPQDICSRILYTGYMGSENSSQETRDRAALLAKEIGSTHYNLSISEVYKSFEQSATDVFGQKPKFSTQGGSWYEDIALQNIQARSRMILAYLMGGLIPWNIQKNGFLLVVGSANLDEGLRGYFTKYDCSSADINPIGSISKTDIKKFLKWNYEKLGIQAAGQIIQAVPTAELRPLGENKNIVQDDESDMGMTYDDLKYYGYFRKVEKMGPVSMFKKLITVWPEKSPEETATKVKHFFKTYSQNRHKQTTLTPAYHVENYSIDDNRFDLRQFLYNPNWTYQFKKIDKLVEELKQQQKK